jgi:hypothetical protein
MYYFERGYGLKTTHNIINKCPAGEIIESQTCFSRKCLNPEKMAVSVKRAMSY